jgi:hypothetical protein
VIRVNHRAAVHDCHTNELLAGWWNDGESKTKVQIGKIDPIVEAGRRSNRPHFSSIPAANPDPAQKQY